MVAITYFFIGYSPKSDNSVDRSRKRRHSSSSGSSYTPRNVRSRSSSGSSTENIQNRNSSPKRPSRSRSREGSETPSQVIINPNQTEPGNEASDASKNPEGQVTNTQNPIKLDDDMLHAIGKRLTSEKKLADPVHSDLEVRWKEIYKDGIPKEVKKELFNKYAQPKNCVFLEAPKLNPEVKASIQEPVLNRDSRLVLKQEKVAVCLSALSSLLSTLLKKEEINKLQFIENLSDSCKILVDLQRDESLTRKSLILSNINASLRDTLKETDVGEFLFGQQLEEKLKAAKLLEKSSKELKPTGKNISKQSSKNSNGPLHQTNKSYGNSRWSKTKGGSGQPRQYNMDKGTQHRTHQQTAYKARNPPYIPRKKKD